MDIQLYAKFFIGLFALVNPVGILPLFISMTNYQDEVSRNKINLTANFSVAVILTVALLFGSAILALFGISIDSFRFAGGMLVMLIALTMINGKIGENKQNKEERSESVIRENIAVVPLALPLMAGPGAISSMIVWSVHYDSWPHIVGFILTLILFSFCCWLLFRLAPYMIRLLGQTGINVVTRIMGLILMSLGAEIMMSGIKGAFPGLL